MSHSYRKPWCVNGYGCWGGKKLVKRWANKKVRRNDDIPNGKAYRKYFESWNINDYRFLLQPSSPWYRKTIRK